MANGSFFTMKPIPYVNGGLLRRVKVFDLALEEIGLLAEGDACGSQPFISISKSKGALPIAIK